MPIFKVLGENITHVGPTGSGQLRKLCNQIAVAVANLALSEALVFEAKMGLDLSKMQNAIEAGAGGSWHLATLTPLMLETVFTVALQQKDPRLVLE